MTDHRIIPRSEWGARYRDGYDDASVPWYENFLHHSVTAQLSASADQYAETQQMLLIEAEGEQKFQAGISYTRLIFPSGRIYQGHSNNRAGAHTLGHNYTARAICFVGNYEVNEPTQAMLESAAWVLQQDKANGLSTGQLTGGHRDVYPTACPGEKAYNKIGYINQLAATGIPAATTTIEELDLFGFNGYAMEVLNGAVTSGYNIPIGSAWLFDATNKILLYFPKDSLRTAAKDAGVMHIGVSGEHVKNLFESIK